MTPAKGHDAADPAGTEPAVGTEPDAVVDPPNYEQSRDELAAVVAALEAGGLSLDESLTLWERGERLAADCHEFLGRARERVDAVLGAADPDR